MYNFDEKEFMIVVGIASTLVMTLEEMRSGDIIKVSWEENGEWILLLAAICMLKMKITLVFIYQKELRDLKDSWVEVIGDYTFYFAATPTSWSNTNIQERWIEKVFDKHTKKKAGQEYWLLIVARH